MRGFADAVTAADGGDDALTPVMAPAPRLTPLEIACGVPLGCSEPAPFSTAGLASPRAELKRTILSALQQPPCVVSFSGGRDSAAVLALATAVARREGLPLPIPMTIRFPTAPNTHETDWQERLMEHLNLRDWEVIEQTDQLDIVGPVARKVLARHGLLWPFNVHFHARILDACMGGSLLTGIGGDELFGEDRSARIRAILRGRERPVPRDVLRVAFACAPRPLRAAALRRRAPEPLPWLTREAGEAFTNGCVALEAAQPRSWRAQLRWLRSVRYLQVGEASLELLARERGATIVHPLAAPRFSAALARLPAPFATRTDAMQELFGDLLPTEVCRRPDKAFFDDAFWNESASAFAAEWDGRGVDTDLVDVDRLREAWATSPTAHSYTLLQSIWLQTANNGTAKEPDLTEIGPPDG